MWCVMQFLCQAVVGETPLGEKHPFRYFNYPSCQEILLIVIFEIKLSEKIFFLTFSLIWKEYFSLFA